MDRVQLTFLAQFDVSAAFDMVDHNILIHCLLVSFGISGKPLDWFCSFVIGACHFIGFT